MVGKYGEARLCVNGSVGAVKETSVKHACVGDVGAPNACAPLVAVFAGFTIALQKFVVLKNCKITPAKNVSR